MKIVYLVPNLKNCGPVNVLLSTIRGIKCEKIVVSLFGERDDPAIIKELKDNGAQYECLFLNSRSLLFDRKTIEKKIEALKPDVINAHGIQSDYLLSKLRNIAAYKVSTIHCNYFEDYKDRFGIILGWLVALAHCRFNNKNDGNICCSKSVYGNMRKHIKNCCVIQNGIITRGYTKSKKQGCKNKILEELRIPKDSTLFVYLGSLSKRKNVANLIKKFVETRKESDYLLIIGDGEQYDKCRELKDSNVRLLGRIENARNYLLASDIYVSDSKSEGLSMSILEAIDAGDSMLLSDIESHKECIELVGAKIAAATFNSECFGESKNLVSQSIRNNPKTLPEDIKYSISSTRMADEYYSVYRMGVKK